MTGCWSPPHAAAAAFMTPRQKTVKHAFDFEVPDKPIVAVLGTGVFAEFAVITEDQELSIYNGR